MATASSLQGSLDVFAVFDGHGGSHTVDLFSSLLHHNLKKCYDSQMEQLAKKRLTGDDVEIGQNYVHDQAKNALLQALDICQNQCDQENKSGCTATVAAMSRFYHIPGRGCLVVELI